jgi:hypothetical protein
MTEIYSAGINFDCVRYVWWRGVRVWLVRLGMYDCFMVPSIGLSVNVECTWILWNFGVIWYIMQSTTQVLSFKLIRYLLKVTEKTSNFRTNLNFWVNPPSWTWNFPIQCKWEIEKRLSDFEIQTQCKRKNVEKLAGNIIRSFRTSVAI